MQEDEKEKVIMSLFRHVTRFFNYIHKKMSTMTKVTIGKVGGKVWKLGMTLALSEQVPKASVRRLL
jgi:hypothetical protein